MTKTLLLAVALVAVGFLAPAYAYPQFQLGRDGTCTGCHIAPDGGGILNENGLNTAEAIALHPGDSAWLHNVTGKPDWLDLGGDLRAAAGYTHPGQSSAAAYPMQAEVSAAAESHGFSLHVTGGLRAPRNNSSALHVLWSREHYVEWQTDPGATTGLYVRVGRLLPTFGLRLAEHISYPQQFGGSQLYDEAYAVAISYVQAGYEVHATGFIHDSLTTAVEHGDGGALYAEARLGEHAALGVEGKYSAAPDQDNTYAGLTGKLYLPGPEIQLEAEGQWIRQKILGGAGDTADKIAAYALGSRMLGSGFMLDVGLGHFTEDTRVSGLYRDCLDANLHFFQTSHLEWLLTTRLELLDHGSGPTGGYALAQIHYRL